MDGVGGKGADEANCPLCVIQKVLKVNNFVRDVVGRSNCDALRRRLAFGARNPHRHGTTDVRVRYWNACCALFVLEGVVQQIYDRALRPRDADVERDEHRVCFVNRGFEGEPSSTGLEAAAQNPVLLRGEVLAGPEDVWGGPRGTGTLLHLFGEDEADVEGESRGASAVGCFVRRRKRSDGGARPRPAEPKVRRRWARGGVGGFVVACIRERSCLYLPPLFPLPFLFICFPF